MTDKTEPTDKQAEFLALQAQRIEDGIEADLGQPFLFELRRKTVEHRLDIGGLTAERRAALTDLAQKLADKVHKESQPDEHPFLRLQLDLLL